MKANYILLFVALSFCSCKSLHFSEMPKGSQLTQKLPPLKPEFDTESFRFQYADIYNTPVDVITGTRTPIDLIEGVAANHIMTEDTKRIFSREIIQNISTSVGETKGYAVCRQGIRSKGIKSVLHPIISIVTLGIPNLFGMKYGDYQDELELIVDIYDINDKPVASYIGAGIGKGRVSLYNGYTLRDAKRLAHGSAFVNAMEEIKEQMLSDADAIAAVLD